MKRELYKVAVNSAKEAEMYKQALLSLGENVRADYRSNTQCEKFDLVYRDNTRGKGWLLGYADGGQSTITFKELIKLLVNAKEPLFIAEDDTEMYEDSECHWVYESKGKWHYSSRVDFCKNHVDLVTNKSNIHKVFGTEENAHHWIDKINKKEKKYLKIERDLNNSGIKIGSEVIVTDGSYMIDAQTNEHVSGIYFNKDGLHEVLKVTKVNHPFQTDYSVLSEILSVHNNCEITGFDNRKYYCSRINIKAI